MPKRTGKDKKGNWMRWGTRGGKHYYNPKNTKSKKTAELKVDKDRKRIEYFKHKK